MVETPKSCSTVPRSDPKVKTDELSPSSSSFLMGEQIITFLHPVSTDTLTSSQKIEENFVE